MGLKVLNATVSVFNVFSKECQVNGDPSLAKDRGDSGKRAKDSLVGIRIPNLASRDIDGFDACPICLEDYV